jgi:TetR/AcrR family transcriptional repressor of nem operon
MEQKSKYIESAIRDAHAAGEIHAPDAGVKTRMLIAYYEGLLTQARIQNDVEVLREAANGMLTILGVKETVAA